MARYHINKHGLPAICRAKPGNCPIGDDNRHFSTPEEAQHHADTEAEREHGMLPGMSNEQMEKNSKTTKDTYRQPVDISVSGEQLNGLQGKDVRVFANGRLYDGPVYDINQEDGKRELKMGTVNGIETVNLDDAASINASPINYLSKDYKEGMKDINRADHKFRYTPEHLDEMKDKYVDVEYDGKPFAGKVIGTHYVDENESGIIIESQDGQVKHVKNYRLNDLEVIGDDENDFKNHVQVKNFSYEATEDARNLEEPDVPEDSDYDPDEEVDKYFSDVIKQKNGEEVDLSKHKVDWEDEVSENEDSYYSQSLGREGDVNDRWTSSSSEAFERDLEKAAATNDYYESKKDFINDIVKKAESTDWTQHGKTQKEGVVDALEYIRDRDLLRGE